MTDPCAHSPVEHHVVNVCEEVIHYPSEDYPCSCPGYAEGLRRGMCGHCEHPESRHMTVRLCRPANGEFCPCRITA